MPADQEQNPSNRFVLYSKRANIGQDYFEWYRCYAADKQVLLNARARKPGKPLQVFRGSNEDKPLIEIRNAKGFLINGRTEIRMQADKELLGSYTRHGVGS